MTGLKHVHKGLIINKANFLSIADNGNVDTPTQLSTTKASCVFVLPSRHPHTQMTVKFSLTVEADQHAFRNFAYTYSLCGHNVH